MTNYFLAYRPFHAEYARSIIRSCYRGEENVVVSHFDIAGISGEGEMIFRDCAGSVTERIAAIRRVKSEFLDKARRGEHLHIHIPHTLGILSNYCYYSLAPRFSNVSISVFYEGIIMFYQYDHHYLRNSGYYLSRWLVSLLSGISYRFNKRLLDLGDDRICRIFTPFTGIDAPPGKVKRIPLEKIEFSVSADSCVILGLRLGARDAGQMRAIINAIYDETEKLNISKVYYKDHPFEENPMFRAEAERRGLKLQVIESRLPVEKIVGDYRPGHVFSVWSSGLINLREMLPGDVVIHSFVTKKIIATDELRNLMEVFRRVGISVHYVNPITA